ncbi:hypothetical protein [Dysgonomonas macrotermitis]|uniref:Uncharacterized protein n=1 Tax=Dysgonomonas macrotermitis TaxID=1346286 RepID=A0A1M5HVE6_9BACT|nr:hypothetical protein [Dysgonomonas macrotermitis]SHG19920.1 hypothetical protein SAMN05444362_11753 [Dysgonomonas macrotermitis]
MKHLLILIFGITLLSQSASGQDTTSTPKHTVVTPKGTRTVSAEDQNRELNDRLRRIAQEREEAREEKQNKKRIIKIVGKIALVAIIGGIAAWVWPRKKKS